MHGDTLQCHGHYQGEVYDKDGNLKGTFEGDNLVTTEGKNYLEEAGLRAQTVVAQWYMGLVDITSYSTIAAADVLASHAGWNEFTGYSGSRPTWTPIAASNGVSANSTSVNFTITASTGTVKGGFIASVASGTSGKLFSVGLWTTGDVPVIVGDVLKITYTLTLS